VRKFPELSKFELTKIYLELFFEDLIGRQFKSAYFTLHILIFGKQAVKILVINLIYLLDCDSG